MFLKFEGVIFGKFSVVHPREGITDKSSYSQAIWLKWPQKGLHRYHPVPIIGFEGLILYIILHKMIG
jgi:hypothetical protein